MQVTRSNVIERADLGGVQATSPRDPTAQAEVDVLLAQRRVVLADVRVARSRLERAVSDVKRDGGGDRGVPDPRRLPRFAATIQPDLTMALGEHGKPRRRRGTHRRRARRGSLPTRERRAALLSLNSVKTHTREPYRKLDVAARADVVAARTRSACAIAANHPGDPRPTRPKPLARSGMLRLACQRLAAAHVNEGEPGPRSASAIDGMTRRSHDGGWDPRGQGSQSRAWAARRCSQPVEISRIG